MVVDKNSLLMEEEGALEVGMGKAVSLILLLFYSCFLLSFRFLCGCKE